MYYSLLSYLVESRLRIPVGHPVTPPTEINTYLAFNSTI